MSTDDVTPETGNSGLRKLEGARGPKVRKSAYFPHVFQHIFSRFWSSKMSQFSEKCRHDKTFCKMFVMITTS